VTFLMTDVVESTPIWLQKRAQMYAAMKRHDQLLTGAIEANGGIVLKERGEGDSFFAVFLRATDAVTAALEAQKALLSEPWTDKIPISVRMAVLTGEADAQDRDYRAPAVNRCAKLRRRAVGNQILVSETTYSIVADILRDDIRPGQRGQTPARGPPPRRGGLASSSTPRSRSTEPSRKTPYNARAGRIDRSIWGQ